MPPFATFETPSNGEVGWFRDLHRHALMAKLRRQLFVWPQLTRFIHDVGGYRLADVA